MIVKADIQIVLNNSSTLRNNKYDFKSLGFLLRKILKTNIQRSKIIEYEKLKGLYISLLFVYKYDFE